MVAAPILFLWFVLSIIGGNNANPGGPPRGPGPITGVNENNLPVVVARPDTKREPLPVFHDLSSLYRSWVSFSTWSPFDTSVATQHEDQIDFDPIFGKIIELGDLYDVTTGQFMRTVHGSGRRLTTRWPPENLGSKTQIDLVFLEHRVVDSMRHLQTMFHRSSSQKPPADWIIHVEKRLFNLERKSELDKKQDMRVFLLKADSNWSDNDGAMPAHLEQTEHIQYLRGTSLRHPGQGTLEIVAEGTEGSKQLDETMKQLVEARASMNLLSLVAAHSSTAYLYIASRDPSIVWKFFELFSAPYHDRAPLKMAVQQAEGIEDISGEQQTIARMTRQIDGMIDGLRRIIECERAIDRHLEVLETTSTTYQGALSDGYLSYNWDAGLEGWVTERKKTGLEDDQSHLGQRECQSLFPLKRGRSNEQRFIDLKPDGNNATEQVIQFVPAARFLHSRYKEDMDYVIMTSGAGKAVEGVVSGVEGQC